MRKIQRHDSKLVLTFYIEINQGIQTLVEVRYKRIRGYTIRVKNDKFEDRKVILTANTILSEMDARKILSKYDSFLHKCFDETKGIRLSSIKDDEFMLFGKIYHVKFQRIDSLIIEEDNIIAKSIDDIYKYAYEKLIERFTMLHDRYNYPKVSLYIRKMKTRWGVCSLRTMKITLAKALIHVPFECVDQVILHELTHLYVSNHSPKFHKELQKVCPNEKELRKQLSNYNEFLYE